MAIGRTTHRGRRNRKYARGQLLYYEDTVFISLLTPIVIPLRKAFCIKRLVVHQAGTCLR